MANVCRKHFAKCIIKLFFFDGEKIAELAVENTNDQMKESIKALLGISILDQLNNDIGRIISRLSAASNEDQDLQYLEQLRKKEILQTMI